jgi:hypothetical protein
MNIITYFVMRRKIATLVSLAEQTRQTKFWAYMFIWLVLVFGTIWSGTFSAVIVWGNKNYVPFIKEQAKAEQLVPFYTLGTIRSAALERNENAFLFSELKF